MFPPSQIDRVGVRLRLGGGEECERAQEEEDHVRPPRRPRQPQEQGRGKSNQTFFPGSEFLALLSALLPLFYHRIRLLWR